MYQLRIFSCQFRYRKHRQNYQACSFLPLFTILSLATMLITSQIAMYADSVCPMTTAGKLPQIKEWGT